MNAGDQVGIAFYVLDALCLHFEVWLIARSGASPRHALRAATMPIPPIAAPRYTVDEIESWPDDGNRYELLDGVLLVTPSPSLTHQLVATEIARILGELVEPWPELRVSAPGAIIIRPKTELQPD